MKFAARAINAIDNANPTARIGKLPLAAPATASTLSSDNGSVGYNDGTNGARKLITVCGLRTAAAPRLDGLERSLCLGTSECCYGVDLRLSLTHADANAWG